eukprot:gene11846-13809_t
MKTYIFLTTVVLFTASLISCSKKEEQPPQKVRFDVSAQMDATGTGSASTAKGNLSAEYLSNTRKLTYTITYTAVDADQVNLHQGTAQVIGNPIVTLKPTTTKYSSPVKGSITLDAASAAALFKDQLYLNITSSKFPKGEIRGQLLVKK